MKKTYFVNVNTLEELRRQYKTLIKTYHPDNLGGSEEVMKSINVEYETLFEHLKNIHEATEEQQNKTKTDYEKQQDAKTWNINIDKEMREALNKIINLSDIIIEIKGSWLWVSGATYGYKDYLKSIGFSFTKKGKVNYWIWNTEQTIIHKRHHMTDEQINERHGCVRIDNNPVYLN